MLKLKLQYVGYLILKPDSLAKTLMLGKIAGGIKLNIQKTKIMTSNPITSWQIDGETVETEVY